MSFRTPPHAVIIGLLVLLAAGFVAVQSAPSAYAAAHTAQAQETPTLQPEPTAPAQTWEEPVNLSHSGAASAFRTVVDHAGALYVVWQETGVDAFTFTRRSPDAGGGTWSEPAAIELPFATDEYYPDLPEDEPIPLFLPHLAATPDGRIYAAWIDDVAQLHVSSVSAEAFADYAAWDGRQTLGEGILAAHLIADPGGVLHLLYLRTAQTAELPAGIYYRRRAPEGDAAEEGLWSEPTLVYSSLYMRTLTAEQANLQLTTTAGGQVLAVWDSPLVEKVLMARSTDGGQTWAAATEIDSRRPEDDVTDSGPSRIGIANAADDVLLLWQAGHEGNICRLYYQASHNAGATWSPPTPIPGPPVAGSAGSCAEYARLLADPAPSGAGDPIYLLTTLLDGVYLLAWNGSASAGEDNADVQDSASSGDAGIWSEPIPQPALQQFVNPDTNQLVNFGCHQAHLTAAGQLLVVGCNQQVADIWFMRRSIGSVDEWFPPPSVWSEPVVAATLNPNALQHLALLPESQSRLHLFWSETQGRSIYYAFNGSADSAGGGIWSQTVPVLNSPGDIAREPSVALAPNDRLLVVWSDPGTNAIYFSESAAGDAANTGAAAAGGAWSQPVSLIEAPSPAVSPEITLAPDGAYYVTFVIPFNEERGVYVTRSDDGGQTWSAPTLVYDGQNEEHNSAAEPGLLFAPDGTLHLMWQRRPLLSGSTVASALLHSRSTDGGQTWSEPELVVEAPVSWHTIVSAGPLLYRIWQQREPGASSGQATITLQFQQSGDAGQTWSYPAILSSVDASLAPAAVTVDDGANLHLLQLTGKALQHWIAPSGADAGTWTVAQSLPLSGDPLPEPAALAVDTTGDHLLVTYTVLIRPATDDATPSQVALRVTGRLLEQGGGAPPVSDQPVAVGTPDPEATAGDTTLDATQTPTPAPTPTITFPTNFENRGSALPFLNTDNRWLRLGIALIPAIFIVLGVLFVRALIVNRR